MNNRDVGYNAFRKFYDYQKKFYPKAVNYSFDELLNSYGTKKEIFIVGWGDMIVNGNVSSSRLDTALVNLAQASQGRKLKNPIQVSNFIQNVNAKIDWIEAAAYVALESTKDVVKGAQAVGDQLIFTGKILNFFLPMIIIFFVLFWINKGTEGSLVRVARAVRK